MTVPLPKCVICGGRDPKRFVVTVDGKTYAFEVCGNHSGPLLDLLQSATPIKPTRRTVVTPEEIEALKPKKRRTKKPA